MEKIWSPKLRYECMVNDLLRRAVESSRVESTESCGVHEEGITTSQELSHSDVRHEEMITRTEVTIFVCDLTTE